MCARIPCALLTSRSRDRPPLNFTQRMWEFVRLDFMGPFPRSRSDNTMIVVSQDRFTEWVEVEPVRRATTATAIRHLEQRVLYRHGFARALVADNRGQFSSHAWRKFLGEVGVTHRPTPVYTPQCNPVERANRTLKIMIRQDVN